MAEFLVSIPSNAPDYVKEVVDEIYIPLAEKLTPLIAEKSVNFSKKNPHKNEGILQAYIDKMEWEVSIMSYPNGNFNITLESSGVTIDRFVNVKKGKIEHSLFELPYRLQGAGLANHVMKASIDMGDKLGIDKIELGANIDVGGYAWLRKGFFPDMGAESLLFIAEENSGNSLYEEFRKATKGLSEEELRKYVLSNDFRKYKDLFLGTSWNGDANITDPVTRTAMLKGANEAYKLASRDTGIPETANEKVADRLVRHQTYLQRFAAGLTRTNSKLLIDTEKEVFDIVVKYAAKIEEVGPLSAKAQRLYKEMSEAIREARAVAYNEINTSVTDDIASMAVAEQYATLTILNESFPVVLGLQPLSETHIKRIVKAAPFEGRTLSQWLEYNQEIDTTRLTLAAKDAMRQGLTPTQVARASVGTLNLKRSDGKSRTAVRDLESVLLTVTNGIANQVKSDLYEANPDVISQVIFVATLDIRTTMVCAGNDGKIFKVGQAPLPPLHFRCRSLLVPYINPNNLGNRAFDPSSQRMLLNEFAEDNQLGRISTVGDLPKGYKTAYNKWAAKRKRELIGQVPATRNFDEWLRAQSDQFQDEYLGPGRAAIFRQGKLSLDKFTTRDGYELTIAELLKLSQAA